jgi:glycolate oxidase iron-sulfur subunit
MRRNIDAWWPMVSAGRVEAIVMNASGCGATVKDYGHALAGDPAYAEKARRIAELTKDVSELLPDLVPHLAGRLRLGETTRLAFHPPCTLQHGQKVRGIVETHLGALGFDVSVARTESHLCCGSAGTYSVLQPEMATTLRDRKLAQLTPLAPQAIVSANIGCIQHLQSGTELPVRHWIEIVDEALAD